MPTYTQRFRDSGDEFVARGTDRDYLPVFKVNGDCEELTKATFPGCLRFMPYAEPIGDMVVTED
ncbi:MAG: hypothetical protein OXF98_11605 [Rhodospirillaceae bacterium]|nr:hypothetical protein [Rhodospirillaceae bacterium]